MRLDQGEQLGLVDVTGDHLAVLDHIDAQQGGVQPEILRQAMQGRTGAKYITHTGLPFSLQPGSQISQHQLFGLHAALLDRLHVTALLRHAQLAVPARGNAPSRRAFSSMSRTSPLARRTKPPSTRRAVSSPAARGLMAYTPDWIFTPPECPAPAARP